MDQAKVIKVKKVGRPGKQIQINNYHVMRSLYACLECEKMKDEVKQFDSKSFSKHFKREHINNIQEINENAKLKLIEGTHYRIIGKVKKQSKYSYKARGEKQNANINQIQPEQQFEANQNEDEIIQLDDGFQDIARQVNDLNEIHVMNYEEEKKRDLDEAEKWVTRLEKVWGEEAFEIISYQQDFINMMLQGKMRPRIRKSLRMKGQLQLIDEDNISIKSKNMNQPEIEIEDNDPKNWFDIVEGIVVEHEWTREEALREYLLMNIKDEIKKLAGLKNLFREIFDKYKELKNEAEINKQQINNNDADKQLSNRGDISQKFDKQFKDCFRKREMELGALVKVYDQIRPIGLHADLTDGNYYWALNQVLRKYRGKLADVLIIDYPWPINSVDKQGRNYVPYSTLSIKDLFKMELAMIQEQGLLFFWVVNSKKMEAFEFLLSQGYRVVDEITWVKKKLHSDELAPGLGTYTQHCKESCIMAIKGSFPFKENLRKFKDVFIASRGQHHSQKPFYIHEVAEGMWPNGVYVELFARLHNLREFWISLGIQLE